MKTRAAAHRLFVALALGVAFLSGCSTGPRVYRRVDQTTPAFKAAVAEETARHVARGRSPASAEQHATLTVAIRTREANDARRVEQITPLAEILTAFERPRGCWAHTATITTRKDDKVTVTVERYDPFQPEERVWTLVSRDGRIPDEPAQADYRRARLRAWKKALSRGEAKETESARAKAKASFADKVEITVAEENSPTVYMLNREAMNKPVIGERPGTRETYAVQHGVLQRRTFQHLGPLSALGGTFEILHFQSEAEYTVIEPELPPFVTRSTARYRASFIGADSGEVERIVVYSDYRRVKCYDDRFGVSIGLPTAMEFLPETGGR